MYWLRRKGYIGIKISFYPSDREVVYLSCSKFGLNGELMPDPLESPDFGMDTDAWWACNFEGDYEGDETDEYWWAFD